MSPSSVVNMDKLYTYCLESVLLGYIQSDSNLLRAIDEFDGDLKVQSNSLLFTIPVLFEFTCIAYEKTHGQALNLTAKSYLSFRKFLYTHPTNSFLQKHGGHVVIETTNKNHDLSIYKLVRDEHASDNA